MILKLVCTYNIAFRVNVPQCLSPVCSDDNGVEVYLLARTGPFRTLSTFFFLLLPPESSIFICFPIRLPKEWNDNSTTAHRLRTRSLPCIKFTFVRRDAKWIILDLIVLSELKKKNFTFWFIVFEFRTDINQFTVCLILGISIHSGINEDLPSKTEHKQCMILNFDTWYLI